MSLSYVWYINTSSLVHVIEVYTSFDNVIAKISKYKENIQVLTNGNNLKLGDMKTSISSMSSGLGQYYSEND